MKRVRGRTDGDSFTSVTEIVNELLIRWNYGLSDTCGTPIITMPSVNNFHISQVGGYTEVRFPRSRRVLN